MGSMGGEGRREMEEERKIGFSVSLSFSFFLSLAVGK